MNEADLCSEGAGEGTGREEGQERSDFELSVFMQIVLFFSFWRQNPDARACAGAVRACFRAPSPIAVREIS